MKVFIFHEDIMAIFVNLTLSCMGDFTDPYCMEWGRCTPSPPPTTYNESGIIRFLCMHNTHSLPLNFLLSLKRPQNFTSSKISSQNVQVLVAGRFF